MEDARTGRHQRISRNRIVGFHLNDGGKGDMKQATADRRRSSRRATSHPAVIYDEQGRMIARASASNLSENGLFVIARMRGGPPQIESVFLELTVPATSNRHPERRRNRTISFSGRIIRTVTLGHLTGLGIVFVEESD